MLFRRSAATTRAHQEKAIRRRKSGRNRLQADRHRGRTGQAGREDFTSLVCQVVRRKSAESAALCAGQGVRVASGDLKRHSLLKHRPSRQARTALPSGCDALRHILLGIIWRIAGGRFAASLHRVAPTPRTAFSA